MEYQMKEQEIEWFEENWNRGKSGRKAEFNPRVWKLRNDIWDEPFEGGMSNENYRNARRWKQHRKAQYRIKKVHTEKKRKPREKEHWRYKKHCHGWKFKYGLKCFRRSFRRNQRLDEPKWSYESLRFMESLSAGVFLKRRTYGYRNMMFKVSNYGYTDWGKEETRYLILQQYEKAYTFSDVWQTSIIVKLEEFDYYFEKKRYNQMDYNLWEYKYRNKRD